MWTWGRTRGFLFGSMLGLLVCWICWHEGNWPLGMPLMQQDTCHDLEKGQKPTTTDAPAFSLSGVYNWEGGEPLLSWFSGSGLVLSSCGQWRSDRCVVIDHQKCIFLVTFSCLFFIKHCYLIILLFSSVHALLIKRRKEKSPKEAHKLKRSSRAHQAHVNSEIILS